MEKATSNRQIPIISWFIHVLFPQMSGSAVTAGDSKVRRTRSLFSNLLFTFMELGAATLVSWLFFKCGFTETNIITVYILGVLVTATVTTSRICSMVCSISSVLIFNFIFTAPRFTFAAYGQGYPVTFLIMLISSFIASSLMVQSNQYARQSAQAAYRTKILLDMNQLLQVSHRRPDIAAVTSGQLIKLLKRDIVFYLVENETLSDPEIFFLDQAQSEAGCCYKSKGERTAAAWVYENNQSAGATTNVFPLCQCMYLAISHKNTIHGVIGIPLQPAPLDSFEYNIILSILGECALAMENELAMRKKAESDMIAENEKLRADLLRGISHDLRTPLTSISGNAGILLSSGSTISPDKKQQLYQDILDDSLWLIQLVENLLAVTRISNGSMSLNLSSELIDEVISEALRHFNRRHIRHNIQVIQEEDFIMAKMDVRLVIQVIINLVDNAIKYTPENSDITITAARKGRQVIVTVSDNGSGIPDQDKQRIFDMFYTASTNIIDSRRSLGLGLALCKSIVEAHGGTITVSDNQTKGSSFCFTLLAQEVTLHEQTACTGS